ncbi:sugar phosphate isomerase/epimerase family protein [Amycolatopsis acidicola]|uniref:sugar phosphate isomerase/epimerase family protein n=1 Tax=Amycolatopsis acidicola TaxID=2596893 RepID=UPI001408C37D|nr:TIM barrel protein [Amycolatopsis acidicola]
MTTDPGLRLGVTLHSFTNEYCSFVWSFEDLMRIAGLLGGGVEIVGPAHHRGFPFVTDEFESQFKSSVDRNGLTPTAYGSYADPFRLPDRDLTGDELVEYTIPQLQGAKKLGFPIVRLQHFTAEVIDRLLPWADKLDLILGWELHVPMTINSDRTQQLLELVRKYDTPRLGLIPDAGIFARSVSQGHLAIGRDAGVPEELIGIVVDAWNRELTLEEALAAVGNPAHDSPITTWVGFVWDTFGHSDPAELTELLPHVVHVHGKFFHIENGDEPDLRYRELVHVLHQGGYAGWISSEYEGDAPDSFEIVSAHQTMIRRHEAEVARS